MNAVKFNLLLEKDYNKFYPILQNWWKEKGWIPYDVSVLSPTGLIVYEAENPICAAWLFRTDSTVGLVGHLITSKDVKLKLKRNGVKFLFEVIEKEAHNLQIRMLVFFITTNSLTKIAEEQGYTNSQQKCNELIKTI